MSYFWLIVLALVVGVGSTRRPLVVEQARGIAVPAVWLICSSAPWQLAAPSLALAQKQRAPR